jgi:hypothetical protein
MPLDSLDMMVHIIRHFFFRAKIAERLGDRVDRRANAAFMQAVRAAEKVARSGDTKFQPRPRDPGPRSAPGGLARFPRGGLHRAGHRPWRMDGPCRLLARFPRGGSGNGADVLRNKALEDLGQRERAGEASPVCRVFRQGAEQRQQAVIVPNRPARTM